MEDEPFTPEEEYAALVRGLKRGNHGFRLHFVRCPKEKHEALIESLKSSLPEKTFATLSLDEPIKTLRDRIEAIKQESSPDLIFIQGLEHSIEAYESEGRALGWTENDFFIRGVPPILSHLNMQRENFRDKTNQGLIFLISDYKLLVYFTRRCPDFFDWRSGSHPLEDWQPPKSTQ